MKRNLLSRRQFMNLCESVFDFEEYGIKPYLKDIRNSHGYRILAYQFDDQDENIYDISFYFNGHDRFSVQISKMYDLGKWNAVSTTGFCLTSPDRFLVLVYHSGLKFLKNSVLNVGDKVYIGG